MTPKKIVSIVGTGIVGLFLLFGVFQAVTVVDSGEIVVKQSFFDGSLTVWSESGPKMQNFGTLTRYSKSEEFSFKAKKMEGAQSNADEPNDSRTDNLDACFRIRFNDNGTAAVCGSVDFTLPTDKEQMKVLHTKFRSFDGVVNRVVRPSLNRAIYNSGPLMSSRESAGDRRAELLASISDQATRGVYRVSVKEIEVEDFFAEAIEVVEMVDEPVLDENGDPRIENGKPVMRKVGKKVKRQPKVRRKIVEPKTDEKGNIEISEPSTASAFGVVLSNFNIDKIIYDKRVMDQIKAQQKAMMSIQTARAEAQKADQDAKTVEAQGRAAVAKAKAEEDVKKQRQTTRAEARMKVAQQDLETAKAKAEATRVAADAEAYAKQKVMTADGALDKKLKAYVDTQRFWAEAASKQRLVPEVQMGASGEGAAGGLQGMMEVMSVKAARDLALDLGVKK